MKTWLQELWARLMLGLWPVGHLSRFDAEVESMLKVMLIAMERPELKTIVCEQECWLHIEVHGTKGPMSWYLWNSDKYYGWLSWGCYQNIGWAAVRPSYTTMLRVKRALRSRTITQVTDLQPPLFKNPITKNP